MSVTCEISLKLRIVAHNYLYRNLKAAVPAIPKLIRCYDDPKNTTNTLIANSGTPLLCLCCLNVIRPSPRT